MLVALQLESPLYPRTTFYFFHAACECPSLSSSVLGSLSFFFPFLLLPGVAQAPALAPVAYCGPEETLHSLYRCCLGSRHS